MSLWRMPLLDIQVLFYYYNTIFNIVVRSLGSVIRKDCKREGGGKVVNTARTEGEPHLSLKSLAPRWGWGFYFRHHGVFVIHPIQRPNSDRLGFFLLRALYPHWSFDQVVFGCIAKLSCGSIKS
jgi:hypothetical protein